jgi:hypothetical protein
MVSLDQEIASILNCAVKDLRDKLNHPENKAKVLKKFLGKTMTTSYKDRNGFNKNFIFGGITHNGANQIMAYGQLRPPFNCSVATHFYARHRIQLAHPYNHCVIEKFKNGHHRFYPLELVKFDELPSKIEAKGLHICPNCLNKDPLKSPKLYIDETDENDGDVSDMSTIYSIWGRDKLSQKGGW